MINLLSESFITGALSIIVIVFLIVFLIITNRKEKDFLNKLIIEVFSSPLSMILTIVTILTLICIPKLVFSIF